MFTPGTSRHRKNLRQAVVEASPGISDTFDRVKKPNAQFITMDDLEPYCERISCPAAALENVFAPYNVKALMITQGQWKAFMEDDFPVHPRNACPEGLTDRQTFILSKFVTSIKTKFGGTLSQRWSTALARNPPNAINTQLKVSALCRLFENTNLPFSVSDFVDALFLFYGERVEAITFAQFVSLLNGFP
jgi:hypothetical protein